MAFTLVLVLALFFAQIATHSHQNGQDEARCQVCQAAHVAPAPAISAVVPHIFVEVECVRLSGTAFCQELFFGVSPSGAPPALFV
jgi:hypothetical protein